MSTGLGKNRSQVCPKNFDPPFVIRTVEKFENIGAM